jgi:hypothetical protein
VRVKDDGKSKRRSVMARIGVEPLGNIIPRESELTSVWSFITRDPGKGLRRKSR